jgi:hypothetical protein
MGNVQLASFQSFQKSYRFVVYIEIQILRGECIFGGEFD